MTNTIEKHKNRKRNFPRGILTPTEEERLRNGNISRQLVYNIRLKTNKAIMTDLPLIFEKIGLESLRYDLPSKLYLKKMSQLYFNLTKSKMMNERRKRGIKRKVSPKAVWSKMRKEIGDMCG